MEYYLTNKDGYKNTCKIFDCKTSTLKDWIYLYKNTNNLSRNNRKPISYKITSKQVKYSIQLLIENQQITMFELAKLIKDKYKNFNITPQHLGQVIRDKNKTRKRTRHEHFPKTKYGKIINKKEELNKFYNKVKNYPIEDIISLDETSIQPAMINEYSRCNLGSRCITIH